MSPSELVEWLLKTDLRDRLRFLRLLQGYVNEKSWRYNTKQVVYSHCRSFFLHNFAALPIDRSFKFKSDIPPVDGKLTRANFIKIIHNSSKLYRAIFLMMWFTCMGSNEFEYVNVNHCGVVLDAVLNRKGIVKLTLPGRKQSRNVRNYYTLLECSKSDFAKAMRDYLKTLAKLPKNCLFMNAHGKPVSRQNIQEYFRRRAVETGVIRLVTPRCARCGGETVKKRRKHLEAFKWRYECRECDWKGWAYEVKVTLCHVRYGVNPHEIRDLMRSRWTPSGADPVVAEFMMGHTVDPNNYNKFMKYESQYVIAEYRKFLPWANILSGDPSKVDRSEIDSKLEARDAEVEVLRREVATLKRLERHLPLLLKLAKDYEKGLEKE